MWSFPLLTRVATFFSSFTQISSSLNSGGDNVEYVPQSKFERFVEAMNRSIRPSVIYSFIILCLLGWISPLRLKEFGVGLSSLPEYYWFGYLAVLLTVAVPKAVNTLRSGPTPPPAPPTPPTPPGSPNG